MNNQVELKNMQDKYQDAIKEVQRTQKKLKDAEENLNDSNSNVNDLVGQLRTREQEREELEKSIKNNQSTDEEEIKNKQIEINQLSLRFHTEKARADKLEQALEQARNENTQLKNQAKEKRLNDDGVVRHYDEFLQFKEHVLKEIAELKEGTNQKETEGRSSESNGAKDKKQSKRKRRKKKLNTADLEPSKQATKSSPEETDDSGTSSEEVEEQEKVEHTQN